MRLWCAAAALYVVAVLVASLRSPDLGLFRHRGSQVVQVDPGGPADTAGIQVGDRIDLRGPIEAGRPVEVLVTRAGQVRAVELVPRRRVPWSSVAGAIFAGFILFLALLADRGADRVAPRRYFRESLVIVFLTAGAFSWQVTLSNLVLAVPWLFSMVLTPPLSCHFMLTHPAGRERFSRREVRLLYLPPLAIGIGFTLLDLYLFSGADPSWHLAAWLTLGALAMASAAVYMTIGALGRMRNARRARATMPIGTRRVLYANGVFAAAPFLGGLVWAAIDLESLIAGGFIRLIAIAVVGACSSIALTVVDVPLGEIDRLLRRRTGFVLATGFAAGVFLLLIALAGGLVSALSGGDFTAALAATIVAALIFGPARSWIQSAIDARFGRDRRRAAELLREAAAAAAATLDVDELGARVVTRVHAGLPLDGAALLGRCPQDDGLWRRVAGHGSVPIGGDLAHGDPIAERLDEAVSAGGVLRPVASGVHAVLVDVPEHPHALVVSVQDGAELADEERHLLCTLAAQLAVALRNARSHELVARMRDEAERRRHEIARLKELVEEENRQLLRQLASREGDEVVVGPGMRRTFDMVHRVGHSESTVLLSGETGAGKEVVARAVHAASSRRGGPFVVIDCASMPAGLIESTLFGHERGSFTGAVRDSLGAFRAADGGTLFLDELGELPLELQPRLLRALQNREVRPVGAAKPVPIDVRVVAGTHRDLAALVAEGRFRQDLWYRLRVIEVHVPALRERRDDILPLAEHFLTQVARRTGRGRKTLTASARLALLEHDWPGNVRELGNAIEAATVYAGGEEILASHLPLADDIVRCRGRERVRRRRADSDGGLREALDGVERERVLEVLREHSGNRSRAARALGISRGALLRRLSRYGIEEAR